MLIVIIHHNLNTRYYNSIQELIYTEKINMNIIKLIFQDLLKVLHKETYRSEGYSYRSM